MEELIDFLFELAKNWRVLISSVGCCALGVALSTLLPEFAFYLGLGGFCFGLAVGFIWQSKQPTFNY